MSQISPPIRIVLVLAVAVTGIYMLFLRPKADVIPPVTPAPNVQTSKPAVSKAGKAAEAAQGAVAASDAQLQQQESVDGVDPGESAAGTTKSGTATAKPPAGTTAPAFVPDDLKGLPKPVQRALRNNKVLVLAFTNGYSADDLAVRAELKKVNRLDGGVSVQNASIKRIARYGRIARGVDVEQSPTIVIADPELRATTLVGYVDAKTVDQAVLDAFRNTPGLFTSSYLREVNSVCTGHADAFVSIPYETSRAATGPDVASVVAVEQTRWGLYASDFKAVNSPAKWNAFKSATVADNELYAATLANLNRYLGRNPSISRVRKGLTRFEPKLDAVNRRYNKRMDAKHLMSCGSEA